MPLFLTTGLLYRAVSSKKLDCLFMANFVCNLVQRWKNRFTKEVIGPIAQQMCLARVIKYSEILEFDRKLREFETHPSLLKAKFDSDGNRLLLAGRYNWGIIREVGELVMVFRQLYYSGNNI